MQAFGTVFFCFFRCNTPILTKYKEIMNRKTAVILTLPLLTSYKETWANFAHVPASNKECYDAFQFQTAHGLSCPPNELYEDPCEVMGEWRDYHTDLTVLESCCYCGDEGGYRNGTLTGAEVKAGIPTSSIAVFPAYVDSVSNVMNGSVIGFVSDFACALGLGITDAGGNVTDLKIVGDYVTEEESLEGYQDCAELLSEGSNSGSLDMCIGKSIYFCLHSYGCLQCFFCRTYVEDYGKVLGPET